MAVRLSYFWAFAIISLFFGEAPALAQTATVDVPNGLTAAQFQAMIQAAAEAHIAENPYDGAGNAQSIKDISNSVLANLDRVAPQELKAVLDAAIPASLGDDAAAADTVTQRAIELAQTYPPAMAANITASAVRRASIGGSAESVNAAMAQIVKTAADASTSDPSAALAIMAGIAQATSDAAGFAAAANAVTQGGHTGMTAEQVAMYGGFVGNPDMIADAFMAALSATDDPVAKAAVAASMARAIAESPDPATMMAAIVRTGVANTPEEVGPNEAPDPVGALGEITSILSSVVATLSEEGRLSELKDVANAAIVAAATQDAAIVGNASDVVRAVARTMTTVSDLSTAALDAIGNGFSQAARLMITSAETLEAQNYNDSDGMLAQAAAEIRKSIDALQTGVANGVTVDASKKAVDTPETKKETVAAAAPATARISAPASAISPATNAMPSVATTPASSPATNWTSTNTGGGSEGVDEIIGQRFPASPS